MRCLIVGGASQLGLLLARKLLNAGHEVLCLDDLRSGRMNSLHDIIGHSGFTHLCRDARERVRCVPDMVIHLIRLGLGEDKVSAGTSSGMDAFMASAELAVETGARLLLVRRLDSFEACMNGGRGSDPVGDEAGEESLEQETRLLAALRYELFRRNELDFRIARLFNVYGLASSRGIDALLSRASSGSAVVLQRAEMEHWFCHQADAVDGLMRLVQTELPRAAPGQFDLACAEPVQARTAGWMAGAAFGVVVKEHGRAAYSVAAMPRLDAAFRWLEWHAGTRFAQGLTLSIGMLRRRTPWSKEAWAVPEPARR
jgi:UDP-glucuronate decarboxylase